MKTFRILVYEDDADWLGSFIYNMRPKLAAKGVVLQVNHKFDSSTVMQDIEWQPHLILVDYDLGTETGEAVIEQLDGDPQLMKTSVFFYSGGETLEELKRIAANFKCGIACYTKEGDTFEHALISKGASI
jgi:hypothetical protein